MASFSLYAEMAPEDVT